MSSQTSLPSQTGPMEWRRVAALRVGLGDERVEGADAQVEPVEKCVAGDEHADQDVPDDAERRGHFVTSGVVAAGSPAAPDSAVAAGVP